MLTVCEIDDNLYTEFDKSERILDYVFVFIIALNHIASYYCINLTSNDTLNKSVPNLCIVY